MVQPVEDDSRGIVDPAELLRTVSFQRHPPSPELGRFVAWYWVIRWDLPPGQVRSQEVVTHPVVNVSFMPGEAVVTGVQADRQERRMAGDDWVIGVMFRPAGFRPFLAAPLRTLANRVVPVADLWGPEADALATAVVAAGPTEAARQRVDDFLAARAPSARHEAEDTADLVEEIAADRSITRVDQLTERTGESSRKLQRRFADHVGASPKWVIRRYRIYEVAERAIRGDDIDWAGLAADLGYSDQAHLSRDFTSAFGEPPGRYLERCRAGRGDPAGVGSTTDGAGEPRR